MPEVEHDELTTNKLKVLLILMRSSNNIITKTKLKIPNSNPIIISEC